MRPNTRLFSHVHPGWLLTLAFAALAWAWPATAAATTIDATTTADALSDDGQCSLREAITAANTDAAVFLGAGECPPGNGADTIVLPAGHFTLTIPGGADNDNATGDLDIFKTTALVGAGASATIIDANHIDRVIHVGAGATVTIQGVTITGGQAPGGGEAASNTGANGSGAGTPGGNGTGVDADPGEGGGGIWNEGTLSILDSVVSDNVAGAGGTGGSGTGGSGANSVNGASGGNGKGGDGGAGGDGGGILTSSITLPGASLRLTRTTVTGNRAGPGGAGGTGRAGAGGRATTGIAGNGGIGTGGSGGLGGTGGGIAQEAAGSVTVEQSTITDNAAGAGGTPGTGLGGPGGQSAGDAGGPGGAGIGGSGGGGGPAGGIYAEGTLTLTDGLIARNSGGAGGGGVSGAGGTGGDDTGAAGDAGQGGDGKGGSGGVGGSPGAIWAGSAASANGTLMATNDTFTNNTAGAGGAGGHGDGGHGGSAATSGTAGDGGNGVGGKGGLGASIGTLYTGSASIVHTTITSNRAGSGGDPGPALSGTPGTGGTAGTPGTAALGAPGAAGTIGGLSLQSATTLENSIVANNDAPSCFGTVTNGAHNIVFPDNSCPGSNLDPLLEALADNGGPTQTQALAPGSPALDAVPTTGSNCLAADQRGVSRPQGAACDIGAYEHAPPTVATQSATGISANDATLTGQVNPNARPTNYHFEYGLTTTYGSSTTSLEAGSGLPTESVSAAVSGLAPARTYHYRLVASNADGTTIAADHTFTTSTSTRGGAGSSGAAGRPRLLGASVRPRVFAVQRDRVNRAGRAKKRGKRQPPMGTTFDFTLSEPAHVVFTIQAILPGHIVGRACMPATNHNRAHRRCVRLGKPRQFGVNPLAGPNHTKFSGRIHGHLLAPGRYQVTLIATDAAGRKSAARRLRFRVVMA